MEKKTKNDDKKDSKEQFTYTYATDLSTGFHYQELPSNGHEGSRVLIQNVIVFMIEGSCSFSYDHYINRIFLAGDMLFFPKSAMVTGFILEDAKFLYMTFDMPLSIFDRQYIQQQWIIAEKIKFDFEPLKINYPIDLFVTSLVYFLQNGGDYLELHDIKHREFFLLLRQFYTREQFTEFFYPIVGKSFNFKNFVLENHANCSNLKELILRSNMCSNVFMRKFKNEFGMSAYQWMLKQMCNKIQHKASQPEITVKEIMREVGVESYSNFNRICRRHFGQNPKQLIMHCQNDILINRRM